MKKKNILIFGGTGLLGKPVAKTLQKNGYKVRIFARSEEKFKEHFNSQFEMAPGDVMNTAAVEKAMEGCGAVHISLSNLDDKAAAENIVKAAKKQQIELITIVTGSTVREENTWFWMMKGKYDAEQVITQSGIPWIIFRPSWFFDTLPRMIRNGKAMVIGKQKNTFHWMAAEDFAGLVLKAYQKSEKTKNKAFYCFGPEVYTLKEALEKYCRLAHPEIKKVGETPVWLMKLIGALSGNNMLKTFTELSVYFTKVQEPGDPAETYKLLGKPEMTMEDWVKKTGN
jgi:uncharacterized protein YbjT (DUF2867 family)